MKINYNYHEKELERTNYYESIKLLEYIAFRNDIEFHNKQVVDLGCNWGVNTFMIANGFPKNEKYQVPQSVIGVDYDNESIRKAIANSKHLNNVDFIVHDITTPFPFEHESIDLFVSTYTIHNFKDVEKQFVFEQVARSLKTNGHFIYIDVLFDNMKEINNISDATTLEKLWRNSAKYLENEDLNILLKVHLDETHPFSLILTGKFEYPITVNMTKNIAEQAGIKLMYVKTIKELVYCKMMVFQK